MPLRLYGVGVAEDDVAWIVAALDRTSTSAAVSAALTLERAAARELS